MTLPSERSSARPGVELRVVATAPEIEWLTVKAAATRISASPSFVRKLILAGKLPASNIGTGEQRAEWRIASDDLEQFMRSARR